MAKSLKENGPLKLLSLHTCGAQQGVELWGELGGVTLWEVCHCRLPPQSALCGVNMQTQLLLQLHACCHAPHLLQP